MILYKIRVFAQDRIFMPICRKHPKLADLYYFLFSNDFSREHHRVINGKYMHLDALKRQVSNTFHLRRQVHRLEKGLIMKDRRPTFAKDYILDAVRNYEILSQQLETNRDVDTDLLKWSEDVFRDYFAAVRHEGEIAEAKSRFDKLQAPTRDAQQLSRPYPQSDIQKSGISYEQFFQLTKQRRSVRWFQDKPVSRELLEKAMMAASNSPSACNRQPFEFRIFDQEEMKNKVGAIPMGIRAYFTQIPVFAVVVGRLSAYLSERDRHIIYIDGGLASMSFMFALETLGLSSVPINWPDIEYLEQKMDTLLNLEIDERPIMLIGIGYADPEGGIPFSQKKSPAQLIQYNK
ncbi:MAG: nitroreductase family protein [Schleiferiaceae bacterium]|nr:nitroreductase family protein [Schleiferiaceae bacterium]